MKYSGVPWLAPMRSTQLLTYLRLLINFWATTFTERVKRITNHRQDFASSRLRVNQVPLSRSHEGEAR